MLTHPDNRTIPVKPNNILSFLSVATVILIISTASPATAGKLGSDLEREQRLADEIVAAMLDGEPVTLATDGHQRLAGGDSDLR